jgi:2-polyprenyl-3-methyl-5-hydroxy-6-metoxy-1,4-benzoquinol methylase
MSPLPPDHAELARRAWDESADAWNELVETGRDYYRTELHGPALLELAAPVPGEAALDLGCGQGWFSRELARAGARVVGVDWADGMLAHARRLEAEAPLGVRYLHLDAARVDEELAPASFSLVTGCMSIMDMPEPERVLRAARTLLAPGGRIVISVPQPANDTTYRRWKRDEQGRKLALEIDRYFDAEATMLKWSEPRVARAFRTVQYRRTLEGWSRVFETAGLLVRKMREPRPSVEAVARRPDLDDARRLPYFLLFELRAE